LYTDGITEAINNEEEDFGEERLEMLVAENAALSAQQLADLILDAVTGFAEKQNLFDDATLIVLKRTSPTG
jgi:sigma-B regulation protein RsbU (phosphoserine phosphatase)